VTWQDCGSASSSFHSPRLYDQSSLTAFMLMAVPTAGLPSWSTAMVLTSIGCPLSTK
jgi:hypothetical protein